MQIFLSLSRVRFAQQAERIVQLCQGDRGLQFVEGIEDVHAFVGIEHLLADHRNAGSEGITIESLPRYKPASRIVNAEFDARDAQPRAADVPEGDIEVEEL